MIEGNPSSSGTREEGVMPSWLFAGFMRTMCPRMRGPRARFVGHARVRLIARALLLMAWHPCAAAAQVTRSGTAGATQRPKTVSTTAAQLGAQLSAQQRRMPDVRDSTLDGARRVLARLKLTPTVATRDTTDQARDGRVADQSPAPLTTLPNAPVEVQLTVYRYVPQRTVVVPNVVGIALPLAIRALARASLVARYGSTVARTLIATVVDQSPAAGTSVAAGDEVTLTVDVTARVPDVTGADRPTALQQLARVGLVMDDRGAEYADSVAAGRVTRQHPEPGTLVHPGDVVGVWISQGPHPVVAAVRMPRLVGLTPPRAEALLASLQLRVTHIDSVIDAARAGRIIDQRPAEGSDVHAGDPVDVRLAVAPAQTRVPWVVGMPWTRGSAILARVGLVARQRLTPLAAGQAPGFIVAQDVDSLQSRPAGATIELTVTDSVVAAPTTRDMPRVIGMTREAATDSLGFLSPEITVVEVATKEAREGGIVLGQSPAPGTGVAPPASVVLRVGRYEAPGPVISQGDTSRAIVPEVVALSLDSARTLLRLAGLTLGDVVIPGTPRDSVVTTQLPVAGIALARGSAVSVVLAVQLPPDDRDGGGGDDGIRRLLPVLLIVGGAIAALLLFRAATRKPPRPTLQVNVRVEPSADAGPDVLRLPDESLVSLTVTLVDAPPAITLDHDGPLIAREEVGHDGRP